MIKPILCRVPGPLYDYLNTMFEREGPHYEDSCKTERGIVVDVALSGASKRKYLIARTTQKYEMPTNARRKEVPVPALLFELLAEYLRDQNELQISHKIKLTNGEHAFTITRED